MTGFRVLVVIRIFSTVIVLVIIVIIHGFGTFGFYFIIISNCVSF